ncbi:MAG: sialate O-acetylesterase [Halioglobus sp.]
MSAIILWVQQLKSSSRHLHHLFLTAVGLSCFALESVAVEVNPLFSQGMVLQQGMAVPIWGTAASGERIAVSFENQTVSTVADTSGHWAVKLESLAPGKPSALRIEGQNTIIIEEVLIGEVWLGSGQSNMEKPTLDFISDDPALKAWSEETQPMLRLHTEQGWIIASKKDIDAFSAFGYAFGRTLQKVLKTPVGILVSAKGAQPSGRWITPEMAAQSPVEKLNYYGSEDYRALLSQQSEDAAAAASGESQSEHLQKKTSVPVSRHLVPGDLWENGVSKFVPFAIRGVLWDQGEAGTGLKGVNPFLAMTALIPGWRKAWNQDTLHFLHVQKPSGGGAAWDSEKPLYYSSLPFAEIRIPPRKLNQYLLAKRLQHIRIGTLPEAPLVTSFDLGGGVHPPDKSSYAQRAVQVALGAVYGRDTAISGPRYISHKLEGGSIRVLFEHTGKGLIARHSTSLQGFELSGANKKWVFAEAMIEGESVLVRSNKISHPKHVRYAAFWPANYANLYNRDGLPALVFSSDKR